MMMTRRRRICTNSNGSRTCYCRLMLRQERQRNVRQPCVTTSSFAFRVLRLMFLTILLAQALTTVAASAAAATTTAALRKRPKKHRNTMALFSKKSTSSVVSRTNNNNNSKNSSNSLQLSFRHWLYYHSRVGLAGGIAGAVGTTVLYPMDAAKTLRQANPSQYASVSAALWALITTTSSTTTTTAHQQFRAILGRLFAGLGPAALGAIPSSALYFGAYESMKSVLSSTMPWPSSSTTTSTRFSNKKKHQRNSPSTNSSTAATPTTFWQRFLLTTGAAASGNIVSSAIFVPKEFLKQQFQYHAMDTTTSGATAAASLLPHNHHHHSRLAVLTNIIRQHGWRGMYRGYQATLLRNIPTAALRFVIYEELKWILSSSSSSLSTTTSTTTTRRNTERNHSQPPQSQPSSSAAASWKHFGAGGIAGAVTSFIMTPTDVLKTRLVTGQCPLDVTSCFWHVLQTTGWGGLYAGAGSRVVFATAFSAIGFGTLEWAKQWLGVPYKNYQEYCQAVVEATAAADSDTGRGNKKNGRKNEQQY